MHSTRHGDRHILIQSGKAGLSQLRQNDVKPNRPTFTPSGKSHLKRTSLSKKAEVSEEEKERRRQSNKVIQRHRAAKDKKYGGSVNGEDDGYDTDLEEETTSDRRLTAAELYMRVCKTLGVTPTAYFLEHMNDDELNLNYHCLGPQGSKALSVPLQINRTITKLNLEGNWMEPDGVRHVAYMLHQNNSITDLNLSYNNLASEGAKEICGALYLNQNIIILDLSGNGFQDKDAPVFKELLLVNQILRELYLSKNEFREEGAILLAQGLAENDHLKTLDLSWNHIRMKGAEAIATSLKENMCLATLNLAMNGFANNGAKALAKALKVNYTLAELDVSNNRIGVEGCTLIAKALKKNDGLEVLRIGLNPIQMAGAMGLVTAIKGNEENVMRELDLSGVTITREFLQIVGEVRMNQEFEVKFGYVSNSDEVAGVGRVFSDKNPLEILLIFMAEQNLRLVDLFKSLDKDHSMSLTRDEFMDGLKDLATPLSVAQLEELINMLDKDGDGEVDLGEIMNINREHRDLKRKVARRMMKQREKARLKMKAAAMAVEAVHVFTEQDAERDRELLRMLGADEEQTSPGGEARPADDTQRAAVGGLKDLSTGGAANTSQVEQNSPNNAGGNANQTEEKTADSDKTGSDTNNRVVSPKDRSEAPGKLQRLHTKASTNLWMPPSHSMDLDRKK